MVNAPCARVWEIDTVPDVDILFLTSVEHHLLLQRFPDFATQYTYAEEGHLMNDSSRRMMIRLSLVRLRSPELIALRDAITTATNTEDAAAIIAEHDLRGVPDEDLSQIMFALGTDVLGQVIWMLIRKASSLSDLEYVAVLTFLRHEILLSYTHAA